MDRHPTRLTDASARDGGAALLRVRRRIDQFRQSLFFLPALFVVGSVVSATALVEVDRGIEPDMLPRFLATTVDNARSILATIAGGTIGAASVVFSLTLVAVQLASSQFSPRVLRDFLGDRFQQLVMGVVVGTFSYSLLVLRVVRAPSDPDGGEVAVPFLPQISVLVAVILAVASLLAVLASIDHTAKRLRVGSVLNRIADSTLDLVDRRYPEQEDDGIAPRPTDEAELVSVPEEALAVRVKTAGWVTQISIQGLAEAAPEGSTVVLETAVGDYQIPHGSVARVWPAEGDGDELASELLESIELRRSRTMQQDVRFGIVQLVDVALRALSPGVNDPNTAIEAVARLGAVLSIVLRRPLEKRRVETERCTVIRTRDPDHRTFVFDAFEPIVRYARNEPAVLSAVAETLGALRWGEPDLASAPAEAVDEMLDTIENDLELIEVERDRKRVEEAIEEARRRHPRFHTVRED